MATLYKCCYLIKNLYCTQTDNDNSTTVNWEEFIAATVSLNEMEHKEHLTAAFTYVEKDANGYITVSKLQKPCMESNTDAILPEDIVLEAKQNNVSLSSDSLPSLV